MTKPKLPKNVKQLFEEGDPDSFRLGGGARVMNPRAVAVARHRAAVEEELSFVELDEWWEEFCAEIAAECVRRIGREVEKELLEAKEKKDV